jgi:hypothetical protein
MERCPEHGCEVLTIPGGVMCPVCQMRPEPLRVSIQTGAFIANFDSQDPNEAVFGPSVIIAQRGEMKLTDKLAIVRARLNKNHGDQRILEEFQAFYEATGGLYALLTKKPLDAHWRLNILVSHRSRFPHMGEGATFPTWETAWAYLCEYGPQE